MVGRGTTVSYTIKDSGKREEFSTGAKRDTQDDKPWFHVDSPYADLRGAKWLGQGGRKYGPNNYKAGMPMSRYLASLKRHLNAFERGLDDEDHLAAVLFNVKGLLHMEEGFKLGKYPVEMIDEGPMSILDPVTKLPTSTVTTPEEPMGDPGDETLVRLDPKHPVYEVRHHTKGENPICDCPFSPRCVQGKEVCYSPTAPTGEEIRQAAKKHPDAFESRVGRPDETLVVQDGEFRWTDDAAHRGLRFIAGEDIRRGDIVGLDPTQACTVVKVKTKGEPKKPKLIYVAGKFSDERGTWYEEQNVRWAEEISKQLWEMGAAVICPHANTRFFNGVVRWDQFMAGDLVMVERSDALVMVPNWKESPGAREEYRRASELKIPTFFWPYDRDTIQKFLRS